MAEKIKMEVSPILHEKPIAIVMDYKPTLFLIAGLIQLEQIARQLSFNLITSQIFIDTINEHPRMDPRVERHKKLSLLENLIGSKTGMLISSELICF